MSFAGNIFHILQVPTSYTRPIQNVNTNEIVLNDCLDHILSVEISNRLSPSSILVTELFGTLKLRL